MKNLKKSWKTTLIGLAIIAYHVYNFIANSVEIDFSVTIQVLIAVGFLATKDADQTHSKE